MPKRDRTLAPPLRPNEVGSFSQTMQMLLQQYKGTLQNLGIQKSSIIGQFGTTKEAILAQRRQELEAAEGTAIERGILGSSGELADRAAVAANATSALAQAKHAKLSSLAALTQQALGAKTEYTLGVFNMLQARKAAQAVREAEEMYENLYGSPTPDKTDGTADEGGLTSQQQQQLQKKRDRIKDLLQVIGALHGADRSEMLARLKKVWEARNVLREQFGLKPVSEDRMWELVNKFTKTV